MNGKPNNGFTTVEILLTLFVGALLLGGGYQLYSIVKKSSTDSRNQTDASNIAYEQLRNYSEGTAGGCVPSVASEETITANIPQPTTLPGILLMKVKRTCPFGNNDEISLITVSITYGESGARYEVSHALYTR